MRIVLVVPAFPQISETFITNKALGLLDRGWDLHLVCGASEDRSWSAYGAAHRVHELRGRVHVSPSISGQWRSAVPAARALAGLRAAPQGIVRRYLNDGTVPPQRRVRDLLVDSTLLRLSPDIVHFEFGALARGRLHLRTRIGAAVTVSFRGYDLNYAGLEENRYYDEIWREADGIHLLGNDLWRRAVRRGAPGDLPHTLIPPAIDTRGIEPIPARPGRLGHDGTALRVLSVGRLHWKKGYDEALDAIAVLRDRGMLVEHRIVGDGPLLEAVTFWRHQLGLDDQVELLRSVPPDEVKRQLAWADVLLHAATSEGFCNAVLEAQAHGVPVVCTDADGLAENIAHDVTGLLVPRRNPSALAAGLIKLAESPDLRQRMGSAGRDRAERDFRLDDQLNAWEQFYSDAVAGRSTSTRVL